MLTRCLVLGLGLSLMGCGSGIIYATEVGILNGNPDVQDSEITRLIAVYQSVQIEPALDVEKLLFVVDSASRESYCRGLSDGCAAGNTAVVPWNTGSCFVDAELAAHELSHVLAYQQNWAGGDPNHTRHDLFARLNGQYAAFEGEIGVATEVAELFCSRR